MKKLIKKNTTVLSNNEYGHLVLEDGIIIATWKASFIDLETAKNAIEDRINVTEGKAYPALVYLGAIKDSTKEARDYLASEPACKGLLAVAICVNSSLENMLGNLFIYMNKPKVPTRVFKDKVKAKKWLSKFAEENQSANPITANCYSTE